MNKEAEELVSKASARAEQRTVLRLSSLALWPLASTQMRKKGKPKLYSRL